MGARAERTAAYDDLATPAMPVGTFAADASLGLPSPARRLLDTALLAGTDLVTTAVLEMEGEIKLKGWMPFRARQVVRAGSGFVWEASVGKGPLRFTGGDTYHRGKGALDFRLWGLIPVARATGDDIDRSARGRLAAETVAWVPPALTPAAGATWKPVDNDHAVVTLPVGDDSFDLTVTVDDDGHLRDVTMRRWGDPDGDEFAEHAFGASVDRVAEFDGVAIAAEGRVGWHWGTDRQPEGEFFRYRITDARFLSKRETLAP